MRHRHDANHNPIREVFERMLGGNVSDTASFGSGAGDLYVSYGPAGAWIEIKRDRKSSLTPAQVEFSRLHSGNWFRVETIGQAENVARIIRARGMTLDDLIPRKVAVS